MQRHVVQPGDTLWQIARRYSGDARQWRAIALANGIGLDAVIGGFAGYFGFDWIADHIDEN
jgi:nucleoid-associated protein YgaU